MYTLPVLPRCIILSPCIDLTSPFLAALRIISCSAVTLALAVVLVLHSLGCLLAIGLLSHPPSPLSFFLRTPLVYQFAGRLAVPLLPPAPPVVPTLGMSPPMQSQVLPACFVRAVRIGSLAVRCDTFSPACRCVPPQDPRMHLGELGRSLEPSYRVVL